MIDSFFMNSIMIDGLDHNGVSTSDGYGQAAPAWSKNSGWPV